MRNVRMIERRERLRFAREASQAIGIAGEGVRKDLQGDVAIQLRVVCAIHFAHAACPEGGENLIRAEPGAGCERQLSWIIWAPVAPLAQVIAARMQDWIDIDGVLVRQGTRLAS